MIKQLVRRPQPLELWKINLLLGVFSLFPIFLYTGYLFLICRKDFLPLAATRRVKLIAQFSLMSLILPLIIFHELASLNGLAYGIQSFIIFFLYPH